MLSSSFCHFQHIFGNPNEGVHKIRFLHLALVDVALTVLVAFLLSFYLKTPFYRVLIVLFLMGIIMHRLFCVRTTVDKLLFPTL
jgi:hypothetical protein